MNGRTPNREPDRQKELKREELKVEGSPLPYELDSAERKQARPDGEQEHLRETLYRPVRIVPMS